MKKTPFFFILRLRFYTIDTLDLKENTEVLLFCSKTCGLRMYTVFTYH